ncbi:MAG: PEGA domain-containing protein [bacterium]
MKVILFLILFVGAGFCQEVEVYVASWPVIDVGILLDGKLVGETPSQFKLKAGKYKFLAKKEGWIGEEREVVIEKEETTPFFINLSMRMVEESRIANCESRIEKRVEPTKEVLPKKEAEVIVVPKKEVVKPKVEEKILELRIEEPKEKTLPEPAKKEDKHATWELIVNAERMIEKAEEEGAERYARKSLSLAKRMLDQAKKESSCEKAKISMAEAERALKEAIEKREQYDSGYISGLTKGFGK